MLISYLALCNDKIMVGKPKPFDPIKMLWCRMTEDSINFRSECKLLKCRRIQSP